MNSSPLSNLFDMDKRRQQWNAEKPAFSNGNELRFSKLGGELVFGYFVSSGGDGDNYILIYKGHAVDTISSKGEKLSITKFCPVLSGYGEECALCEAGNTKIKDRMAMWFYVTNILHANLPQNKQLPIADWGGRNYYQEEVQGFRIWYASAWSESPWDDIVRFQTLYKGLHNLQFMMTCSGQMMTRRYKMNAMPEPSQLPPELYERAKVECRPIPELLKESLSGQVQQAPEQALASAPAGSPLESFNPSLPTSSPVSSAPQEMPQMVPEEDDKRPLKGMF